jgi:hypothetical protein
MLEIVTKRYVVFVRKTLDSMTAIAAQMPVLLNCTSLACARWNRKDVRRCWEPTPCVNMGAERVQEYMVCAKKENRRVLGIEVLLKILQNDGIFRQLDRIRNRDGLQEGLILITQTWVKQRRKLRLPSSARSLLESSFI